MPSLAVTKPPTLTQKENEKKWGKALLAPGWSTIPSAILLKQDELKLTANDINILMHLIAHWWYAERLPYPSIAEIARRMRVHRSTVQRSLRSMEQRKLLTRNTRTNRSRGRLTNSYDLDGLIRKATPLAKELAKEKEKARKSKGLKVVHEEG